MDPEGLFQIKVGGKKYELRITSREHHGINPPEFHVHELTSKSGDKIGLETGNIYDISGKIIKGNVGKKVHARLLQKFGPILKRIGQLGLAIEIVSACLDLNKALAQTEDTLNNEEASLDDFNKLLDVLQYVPQDRREMMLKEIIENNPAKFVEIR